MKLITLLLFLSTVSIYAQESTVDEPKSIVEEEDHELPVPTINSSTLRDEYPVAFFLNYSAFETWIPSKIGLTGTYHFSKDSVWDLEFLRGSIPLKLFDIDLGSFSDTRVSLLYRSFSRRTTFNFFYGAFYNSIKARIGDSLVEVLNNSSNLNLSLLDIQNIGFTWGFGNRWQLKNRLNLGIDWFVINIPIKNLENSVPAIDNANRTSSNEEELDRLEKLVKIFRKAPTFTLFKLQIGYSF